MAKRKNDFGTVIIAVFFVFVIAGVGGSSNSEGGAIITTCNDGIDNDGDLYFDWSGTGEPWDDWDCDPSNPNYTGEEDGNANSTQNNQPA